MISDAKRPSLESHRWMVFAVISSIYFFVYFHRVSTSVIAPDLLAEFHTNATALGIMASMYFYVYALEQPLVGHLSDLLGPRRVVGLWSLAAALGCVIFGFAPNIFWASVGRAVIGFGVGGVYVPALKAFSQWFREREFATMTGLLLAAGNLGAIVATTPLAWMASTWGWRSSFLIIAAVTLGLAAAAFLVTRDYEERPQDIPSKGAPGQDRHESSQGESAWRVLASIRFWVLATLFFGFFGTFLTFQGLWATPYLMSVLEVTQMEASRLNMLIPLGFLVGAPFSGWLADRVFKNKAHILVVIIALQAGIWAGYVSGGHILGLGGMIPLLVLMGGSAGGFATALWGLVRESTPAPVLGATSGLLNPAPFFGVAVIQVLTGAVLDRVSPGGDVYSPAAYREAFSICLFIVFLCLILSLGFRKRLLTEAS